MKPDRDMHQKPGSNLHPSTPETVNVPEKVSDEALLEQFSAGLEAIPLNTPAEKQAFINDLRAFCFDQKRQAVVNRAHSVFTDPNSLPRSIVLLDPEPDTDK